MGKTVKFPGISEQVQGLLDANMDQVAARRRAREAFKDIQLSVDYCLFKVYIHTYIHTYFHINYLIPLLF